MFVVSRVGALTAGLLGVLLVGYGEDGPPFRISENEVLNLPARWDAGWYLGIADDGYDGSVLSSGRRGQQDIAFFPAYPMVVRVAGDLLGAGVARPRLVKGRIEDPRSVRLLWGGVAVSLVAFFIALVYLFRLVRDDFGEEVTQGRVLLLAAYPFAVFFSAAYTESLFLLGTVATFYHFRRGEYTLAGVWGVVVGLTKTNGFLLSVPLLLLWLPAAIRRFRRTSPPATPPPGAAGLVATIMPATGMCLYSAYLYGLTGKPLAWLQAHEQGWNRRFGEVGHLILERYNLVIQHGFYVYLASSPAELVNGLAALLAVALVWPVWRRLGISYASLMVVVVVPPLLAGGFVSLGRFTSVLFPMFVYLAVVLPRGWRMGVALFFMQLQTLWR